MQANSGDPYQTPNFAASGLCLHCLPMSHKKVARLIWVKAAFHQSTRDVLYVRRVVDLMKTAKVNAYIMYIFGKNELLSIHAI